ncbi:hypothetical protein NX059_004152 [Plenodomus lindquistii]|nr:hypothetical protein NX059_004152 [Plenodomus lindquistii]
MTTHRCAFQATTSTTFGFIPIFVDSPHRGGINSEGNAFKTVLTQLDQAVPPYIRNRYRNGSLPQVCNVYTRPSVAITIQDADCPWNETFCSGKDVLSMGSGLVDIGKAFGLNLEAEDRIEYRRKETCPVLPMEGHMAVWNNTELDPVILTTRRPLPGELFIGLNYQFFGDVTSKDCTFTTSSLSSNVTAAPNFGKLVIIASKVA